MCICVNRDLFPNLISFIPVREMIFIVLPSYVSLATIKLVYESWIACTSNNILRSYMSIIKIIRLFSSAISASFIWFILPVRRVKSVIGNLIHSISLLARSLSRFSVIQASHWTLKILCCLPLGLNV